MESLNLEKFIELKVKVEVQNAIERMFRGTTFKITPIPWQVTSKQETAPVPLPEAEDEKTGAKKRTLRNHKRGPVVFPGISEAIRSILKTRKGSKSPKELDLDAVATKLMIKGFGGMIDGADDEKHHQMRITLKHRSRTALDKWVTKGKARRTDKNGVAYYSMISDG